MKYLIIGDSHVLRLRNVFGAFPAEDCEFGPNDVPITSKCMQNHMSIINDNLISFSGHRGKTGYKGSYYHDNLYPCLEKFKSPEFVILPWFGYIDVKQFLPREGFQNPKEAVQAYVNNTFDYFQNNKIRFIEPLPQFVNILGFGSPLLPFEDRHPYQVEFIKYLREESEKRGLENPINMEKILGTDRLFAEHECITCRDCEDPQYAAYKLDHPKKEVFQDIMDGILKEMNISI